MSLSHPDDHIGGLTLFKHAWKLRWLLMPKFTCKMVDCPAKFASVYSKFSDTILRNNDEVVYVDLPDAASLKLLRNRALRHADWYLSLNILGDTIRPTLAPISLFGEKVVAQGKRVVGVEQGVVMLFRAGIDRPVRQLNRPQLLDPESDWQWVVDMSEPNPRNAKKALRGLGMEDGRFKGKSRHWSAEELALNVLDVVNEDAVELGW